MIRFSRRSLVSLVLAVVLVPVPATIYGADPDALCRGESAAFSIGATVISLQPFVEVQLSVMNRAAGGQSFDPTQVNLVHGNTVVPPLTVQEAKNRMKDMGGHMVALLVGPIGLIMSVAKQATAVRDVDHRAMRPQEVAAGKEVRGSVYFPAMENPPKQVRLTTGNGMRLACPVITAETEAVPATTVTLSLTDSARAGSFVARASYVEFTPEATAVEVVFENQGSAAADPFWAQASAVLQSGGAALPIRATRSDLAQAVEPGGKATARLVFDRMALPTAGWSAVLVLPGIRMGSEEQEIRLSLTFPGGAR